MLQISKEKTLKIKGVVILMMVFLHLFNGDHTSLCTNIFCIGEVPFAKWLAGACGPVEFFLLLSGFGLARSFETKGLSFGQQFKRILKLYIHYWVVLLIFLPIGWLMLPNYYPGSVWKLLLNASGYEWSYNGEMWFLFPYIILSLLSPLVIPAIKRIGWKRALVIAAITHVCTCYMISRYGYMLYGNHFIYNPLLVFHFLYAFTVGVVFNEIPINLNCRLPNWIPLVLIGLVVALVATFGNAMVYMVYVPLMVFMFCQVSLPKWLGKVLEELGKRSMPIWMIHTWLCYYLFQPQVYALRYPVLIFGGVVLVSYLLSIPVMWTAKKFILLIKL